MPTDQGVLGFSNRFYRPAMASAHRVDVAGFGIRFITPVYFLATKFEAFRSRGNDDFDGNPDLEDLVAVIDGRREIVDEVGAAPPEVRSYLVAEFGQLLATARFVDALPGFLLPDPASQQRLPILLARLKELSQLGPA